MEKLRVDAQILKEQRMIKDSATMSQATGRSNKMKTK